ncbi:MAG TPA: T9SS type A sorting domain-containing protein [Flavisolibacter sp.]
MKQVIRFFLPALLLISGSAYSQPWLESMSSGNAPFQQIKNQFESHWAGKQVGKGTGYKQFKRWEYFWGQRLLPDGSLPPATVTLEAINQYRLLYPQHQQKTLTNSNWTFQGPSSSSSGYYGVGRVNCIAFHPTDPNTFWVGTPAGGLWKTTDNGSTWTCNTDQLPVLGVSNIAVDPSNPSVMYIATGDPDGSDTYSLGVLKTTDGGATWNATGLVWSTTNFKQIKKLLMNPANPAVLMVFASDGIYRTTNSGASWSNVRGGNFSDAEFRPGDPSTVYASEYAGSDAQVLRSQDGGATWTTVGTLTGARRVNLAVTPANADLVDAVASNNSGGLAGMWKSTNSGASFTQYFTGTSTTNYLNSSSTATGTSGQGGYDLSYAINPSDANQIWLGGVNTYMSASGGSTWTLKAYWNGSAPGGAATVHADHHNFVFHPLVPNMLYDCNDGGLYRTSTDGAGWEDISTGLGNSQIYRIAVASTVNNKVLAGLQDNSTKLKNNTNWYDIHATGDGMNNIISWADANVMYSASYNGNISKSTNGGNSWSQIAGSGGTGVNGSGAWITPYVQHPTEPNTLLVGKDQLYKTSNAGSTWETLSPGIPGNLLVIAYAPSNPQVIYVANSSSIARTADGGASWTTVYTGGGTITSITVSPLNPDKVWVTRSTYGSSNRVMLSTNGGTNWQDYSGNLPALPVNCSIYQNGTNDVIYVGTDMGVFFRDASMSSWIPYQTGLPNTVVQDLEITYSDGRIWAATYGRGLWSSPMFNPSGCTSPASPVSDGDKSVCANAGPVTLSVTVPSGTVVDWYTTLTGGTPVATGTNTYSTSVAGSYFAQARNTADNCTSYARTEVKLTLNPIPAQPTITQVTTFLQSSYVQGNQWYLNGVAIPGAVGEYHQPTTSGLYSVQVTSNGCVSTMSQSVNYIVASVNSPELNRDIIVAPNPVQHMLTVKYTGNSSRLSVQVMDITGRQVVATGYFTSTWSTDMRKFAPGTYVVRVVNERNGEHVQRLIIKSE